MAIIVQKFGGTSVANAETRRAVLRQVSKARYEGHQVVVVVSAMGRKGDPYATDTLLDLLEEIGPVASPRKNDLIMSCGEIISSALLSHYLDSSGIPSEPLTGFQAGIETTEEFNNSEVININISKIMEVLEQGKVPVIAGFQGITKSGEITTLGRGGGDTAAVAIGGYLKADRVDIFTDVFGIAKIDPRIIPTAPYMSTVSYKNMINLAQNGAKVIHPRAVALAERFNIDLRVRSTFSESEGTRITGEEDSSDESVIGLAVEKGERFSKLFVLVNDQMIKEIKMELNQFMENLDPKIDEVVWDNNSFVMKLPTLSSIEIIKGLYEKFCRRSYD
ncbi:MAG: aspartate kinase [Bacillota bacterium]|nr:aspartate kinase [Bacillota bacterium]